jgi:hypothetical protein
VIDMRAIGRLPKFIFTTMNFDLGGSSTTAMAMGVWLENSPYLPLFERSAIYAPSCNQNPDRRNCRPGWCGSLNDYDDRAAD